MNYFPIREKVQFPHQVLLSSHSLLSRENSFSRKDPIFSNKNLAFGSVIEGVPNSLFWVSYEDLLLRFGFELIMLKLFHISIAVPNFKKRQLRFLAKPQFIWCHLNGFRWCPLFNVNAAVSNA